MIDLKRVRSRSDAQKIIDKLEKFKQDIKENPMSQDVGVAAKALKSSLDNL
jgi:hypothetical protein